MNNPNFFRRVTLLLAALALGASAASCFAATLPLKGETHGGVVGSPTGRDFLYAVDLSGSGKCTVMGKFGVIAHHTTDGATGAIIEGSITFTAKNGDTITGTYTGQESLTDSPFVVVAEATVTITGGTGRFRGANGTVPLMAVVSIQDITSDGVFIETFDAVFDAKLAHASPGALRKISEGK